MSQKLVLPFNMPNTENVFVEKRSIFFWKGICTKFISKRFILFISDQRMYIYLYSTMCTTLLLTWILSLFLNNLRKHYVSLWSYDTIFFHKIEARFFYSKDWASSFCEKDGVIWHWNCMNFITVSRGSFYISFIHFGHRNCLTATFKTPRYSTQHYTFSSSWASAMGSVQEKNASSELHKYFKEERTSFEHIF